MGEPWRRDDPVILLGMHRSGTSLVTKIVRALGVFIGASVEENSEPPFYIKLNDWILGLAHASWDNPLPFGFLGREGALMDLLVERTRERVSGIGFFRGYLGLPGASRFLLKRSSAWGWKDPRSMITFPVWRRVYPRAKFIVVLREALPVALSLSRREKDALSRPESTLFSDASRFYSARCQDPLEALALWEEYHRMYLDSASVLDGSPVLHLRYETLLERPHETVEQIASFLGLGDRRARVAAAARIVDPSQGRRSGTKDDPSLIELIQRIDASEMVRKVANLR